MALRRAARSASRGLFARPTIIVLKAPLAGGEGEGFEPFDEARF